MRIGIITFHYVNNFGGALQTYALQRVVREQCNCESVVINYRNWFIRFTDTIRILPITLKMDEIKSGLSTIVLRKKRLQKFRDFIRDNCLLTSLYTSNSALKKSLPNFDKYICGSDQVWNPIITAGVAKPYYLEFEKEKQKKIAYAPSMGTNRIHPYFLKRMKKYINNIGYLSIREESGIATIKELTDREAIQLIDPTFLLEEKEWNDIAVCPIQEEKYILIYIMQKDEEVYSHARWMKEKWNVPVVDISRYGYKPDFVDISLVDLGPNEFIGLFQNAEYVCTNSYHGLVFSLIFRKQICLIPSKRFHTRISNLLKLLQIKQYNNGTDTESYILEYDVDKINKVICNEKRKSINYLKDCIEK